jgi:tetratricopeptide (TPR) repeat protein
VLRALALAAAVLLAAAPAAAQRGRVDVNAVPARPALLPGADTADATAYFTLGVQNLDGNPRRAADAFYWASRLEPGWADAVYGRHTALVMSLSDDRFLRYMWRERSVVRSPDIQAIDSLYLRALSMEPFLYRKFDRQLYRLLLQRWAEWTFRRAGEVPNPAAINDWVNNWMNDIDPDWRGRWAYAEGRFPEAVQHLERAVRTTRRGRAGVRADLARALLLSGDLPRARAEMGLALEDLRKEDERDLVFVYESKALLEFSVAAIHERLSHPDSAREAYGRALQEDLAYAPAHVRMAGLSLAAGDTAGAVAAMDLAVQLAPDNAAFRYEYARLLAAVRRYPEAMEELNRAAGLEPYYAAPHLLLAKIYDASGMRLEAVEHYTHFVDRAARNNRDRAPAQGRRDAIQAALRAEAGTP